MSRTPESMKRLVATRARGYCEYCRCSEQFATETFTVEHIKPKQAGGETVLENLAWSCFGCNGHKHSKVKALDLETGEKIALYNPRQQVWSEHFEWSNDFTQVIGKTPCGRATVEALHLNRFGVVNLRRLLRSVNLHPPE
ncbi:HNH endonuclease [Dulcicalothrix desertica PCC 7102]|uniref:HNH endonuclease n=1 Tax=Dulcicalothrix desertica PCC 7102 TaxID=232991 RepID=A0A433UIC7_9CYAN|nr:HNH endonuclease signature motif containing protein [Dulcicalothrix desertica]RUS93592.1 HNH endonuclease [Dulcicalothrix desertica PCC 7102]TWH54965.1 HNH endonuclease [Dulcicalothrix desertica PCC 7102]